MSTCTQSALDLRTYYAGKNQATHPNVIGFDTPWHGYRYYMAYTAYPYANGSEENPCIAASNDLIHWEKPDGLINPIACCEELECDELKDTHWLYRSDLDRLELWYLGRLRGTIQDGTPLYCFRKSSSDGIIWSQWEVMYCFGTFGLASPSIYWDPTGYHFWGIRHVRDDIGTYYMHSADGFTWSDLRKCNIPQCEQTNMWHGAVSMVNGTFYYVWVGYAGKPSGTIFLSTSTDGLNFSEPRVIIQNDTRWQRLYRPALIAADNVFYCFYGVIRCDNKWMIGMSSGSDPYQMVGMTANELGNDPERIASTRRLHVKDTMQRIRNLLIPRMVLLSPLILLLQFLLGSAWLTLACSVVLCTAAYTRFNKRTCIAGGLLMGMICAGISNYVHALLMEGLSVLHIW